MIRVDRNENKVVLKENVPRPSSLGLPAINIFARLAYVDIVIPIVVFQLGVTEHSVSMESKHERWDEDTYILYHTHIYVLLQMDISS